MQPQRKRHPRECPTCEGFGYTEETGTIWTTVDRHDPERGRTTKKYKTVRQGSGCPACLGTGRLP